MFCFQVTNYSVSANVKYARYETQKDEVEIFYLLDLKAILGNIIPNMGIPEIY